METKELIAKLLEYAEWADANEYETPLCLGDDLRAAADALQAAKASNWVSVKDRLPEEWERVLVACADGVVRLNRLEYGEFSTILNRQHMFVKTTHWMPLPEPPREEK